MTTPNLGLQDSPQNSALISAAVNTALQILDGLVQCAVEAVLSAPPVTVIGDIGKRWIIGAAPSGVWAGKTGQIAICTAATIWVYVVPREGFTAWDRAADRWRDYDGAAWNLRDTTTGSGFSAYISGLKIEFVSVNSLRCTSGAAHIESLDRIVSVPAAITKAGLSLSNNTWYHVYLFVSGGAADIEIVTTAPAAPYNGNGRGKTGVTTRRYLGSVRTNGSGQLYNFRVTGESRCAVAYLEDVTASPFRVLTNGTNTAATAVACSAVAPVTATAVYASPQIVGGAVGIKLASGAGMTGFVYTINPNQILPAEWQLNASQQMFYQAISATAAGLYIDVWGFTIER